MSKVTNDMIGKKVIARGTNSGVFYGTLAEQDGQEVRLTNVRNIWKWSGARCLMDMAKDGVNEPEKCNFSVVLSEIVMTDCIQILPVTDKAENIIEAVPEWTM